ncbi:MAG: ABC transporter ATP-binding protein [Nitrososphaerales archaeon]
MLNVNEVQAYYGDSRVLQGVSLYVDNGEIVSIIGRNGVGKTTLLKCIIGLVKCRGGSIHYRGSDITNLPVHKRARMGVGYVPQGRMIFPQLTVEENLRLGMIEHSKEIGEGSFKQVLEYFPILKDRLRQKGGTLSGGEQQMLTISRTLVGQPDLLLLDEPSEGLQPSIIQLIAEKLKMISQEMQKTIILVEQNLELALSLAKRCYIMEKGLIVKDTLPRLLRDDAIREYLAV